jgi:hypothetical protein
MIEQRSSPAGGCALLLVGFFWLEGLGVPISAWRRLVQ